MPSDSYTLVISDVGLATPIDGSVTTVKIANANVTLAKLQNIATDNLIGRSTAGTGVPELIPCTSFARTLLDDSNAATAQATLGLGNLATQNSSSVTVTGGSISGVSLSGSISSTATITGGTISTATISGCTITGGSIATNTLTGTVAVANGGTNLASYTVGDMLYASGTTTLSKLAAGAASTVLLSGTTPSWGKVPLTTHVSGVLPVANGGTAYSERAYGALSAQNANTSQSLTTSLAKLTGPATVLDGVQNFTDDGGTSNRLLYTGTQTRVFLVSAYVDVDNANSGDTIAIAIGKNNSVISESERRCNTVSGPNSTFDDHEAHLSTSWFVTLSTGDYVEIFISAPHGAITATTRRLMLIATTV